MAVTGIRQRMARRRARNRGGVIIGVLFFLLIISILLMGIATMAVSHQNLEDVDAKYSAAVDLAEAGINYEFRKISQNAAAADQYPGAAYSFGGGAFKVYCVNRDGSAPWAAPNDLYVISTGTVGSVSRTVKVSVKGFGNQGKYAVYGIHSVDLQGNVQVVGDVGSNGPISKGNSCDIAGSVYLNGPGASFTGSGVTVVTNPQPLIWPTVEEKAPALFPAGAQYGTGGLSWLRFHNDNAKAGLPTDGNSASVTGAVTFVGPGDYYVTGIALKGNKQVRFDNRQGPIRIWVGPAGGAGSVDFNGTTDATTDSTASGHQVDVLVATTGGVSMQGNSTIAANLYVYNKDAAGNPYGSIVNGGTPDVYGSILAYDVYLHGNPGIHYVPGVKQPSSIGYYGYDNSWSELNGR